MNNLLMIIDGNGTYADGRHIQLETVDESFYINLVNAIDDYDVIIYQMNLPYLKTEEEFIMAMKVDPFLTLVPADKKNKIIVIKHGLDTPLEWTTEGVSIQDEFAKHGFDFSLCGLYTDWCVQANYENLKSRLSKFNTRIGVNYFLSRPSSAYVENNNFGRRK